jgi:selT/selW/selH-like putative selenoprotein
LPRAASLAAEIKARLGVTVELVEGSRGAFEIVRDGVPVFSKLQRGRFPKDDAEVIALLVP